MFCGGSGEFSPEQKTPAHQCEKKEQETMDLHKFKPGKSSNGLCLFSDDLFICSGLADSERHGMAGSKRWPKQKE
jgi:hypothetical protein